MKRAVAVLCGILLLCGMTVPAVFAQPVAEAEQIPVTVSQEFPAVVEELLMDEAVIKGTEYLSIEVIETVLDRCARELAEEENAVVMVPVDVMVDIPFLRRCATAECTQDYIYSTYYKQGIKYEWIHYLDGRVQKTVSYDYEERTSDFKKYTYSIVNYNNERLEQGRVEITDGQIRFHLTDFLFGMATAVVIIMLAALVVRFIVKR